MRRFALAIALAMPLLGVGPAVVRADEASAVAPSAERIPVDADAQFKNWGVGALPCGEFVRFREMPESPVGPYDATFRQWLMGFSTAFNILDPATADLLGPIAVEDAMSWLEGYCRRNPKHEFLNAVWRFSEKAYAGRTRQNLSVARQ